MVLLFAHSDFDLTAATAAAAMSTHATANLIIIDSGYDHTLTDTSTFTELYHVPIYYYANNDEDIESKLLENSPGLFLEYICGGVIATVKRTRKEMLNLLRLSLHPVLYSRKGCNLIA